VLFGVGEELDLVGGCHRRRMVATGVKRDARIPGNSDK